MISSMMSSKVTRPTISKRGFEGSSVRVSLTKPMWVPPFLNAFSASTNFVSLKKLSTFRWKIGMKSPKRISSSGSAIIKSLVTKSPT